MKTFLPTLLSFLLSVPLFSQFEASFSMGKLNHRLAPDAEDFDDLPYWKTSITNWYSFRYAKHGDSSRYVLELRLKQKKGNFDTFDGGLAGGNSLHVAYDSYYLNAEFRRRIRLFFPKILYAELGVYTGQMISSNINGDVTRYVPPPFNQGNGTRQLSGSAKEYLRSFDAGLSSVIGVQYMFTKHVGAIGQFFLNQSLFKSWDGKMKPAREWGAGIGLKFWLAVKS